MNLIALILSFLQSVVLKVATALFLVNVGKNKQKLKQAEEVLDDISKAKEARDRLITDGKYAEWVRNKFTRK